MSGQRANSFAACSSDTTGFLKKLPALPSTFGSGSFARRIATTASRMFFSDGPPSSSTRRETSS